jgi:hypothetical protein
MLRKIMFPLALCGLWMMAAPAAWAACPGGFFALDLKTGEQVNSGLAPYVSYTASGALAPVPAATGCPGWSMAALKIVIPGAPNACKQANVVVEYEGQPKLWTVNLGDSPTNDGFSGDAGTTANNAELWINAENLFLANGGNQPSVINNPQVLQHLGLSDGAVKLVVKNQIVSWSQPYSLAQAPASKNLFAIPDKTVAAADQRAIYLGLNRVITSRPDRTGCGARRVLISFQ